MQRPAGTLTLVGAFALAVLFLGTSYKTITIDGTNDFSADETFQGTSSSTWYFTWDADALYLGAQNNDISSNSSTKWLLWYIDTDPRAVPSQGAGSLNGQMYNTQQPALPFTANYHLRWKADNNYLDLQTYNGSSWTSGDQTGIQRSRSGNFIELKIPRANLGSPGQIYVCAMMINEAGGAEWTYYIVPANHSDGYDVNITHYVGFTLEDGKSPNDAGNVDISLPIQLMSFKGVAVSGGEVQLTWSTASEVQNYGFEVQRAPQGTKEFAPVTGGFVPGNGTTVERHDYTFVDRSARAGRWSYRLKQVDLDGTYSLTDAVDVIVVAGIDATGLPLQTRLFPNYPNPFNPATTLQFSIGREVLLSGTPPGGGEGGPGNHVTLAVYDLLGRQAALLVNETRPPGIYQVKWDAAGQPSGLYFIRLQSGGRLVVAKMILAK
jgi:hypothetical protein